LFDKFHFHTKFAILCTFQYLSTGAELIDKINSGILGQEKAFFEGIASLWLKKNNEVLAKKD